MAPHLTECRPLFSALDPHTQCTRTYANSRHNQEMVVGVQRKYRVQWAMRAVFSFQSCPVCEAEMEVRNAHCAEE